MVDSKDPVFRFQPMWGKWCADALIGSDRYGCVYSAYSGDPGLGTCAVRHITANKGPQGTASIVSSVDGILRYIKLMNALKDCPGIVSILDKAVFHDEDTDAWNILLRTELTISFDKYLMRNGITAQTACRLGLDVCRALECFEKAGLSTGGFNRSNIFVSRDGGFKLGDLFGCTDAPELSSHAGYDALDLPPEAYDDNGNAGSGDINSLGILLYTLLNDNRPPYLPVSSRSGAEYVLAPPAHGSDALKGIVLKACAPLAADRFRTAREMQSALFGCISTEDSSALIIPGADAAQPVFGSGAAQSGTVITGHGGESAPSYDEADDDALAPKSGASGRSVSKLIWIPIGIGCAAVLGAGIFFGIRLLKPAPAVVPAAVEQYHAEISEPEYENEEYGDHEEADEADIYEPAPEDVDDIIVWSDPALESCIREALLMPSGDIHESDVQHVTSLDLAGKGITDISPLKYFTGLRQLTLENNEIYDISALAELTSLEDLSLRSNHISDISALSGMYALQKLSLRENEIYDITPLSGLSNLKELFIGYNRIADISPLSGLSSLVDFRAMKNALIDISVVRCFTELCYLDLGDNAIYDISPVESLFKLTDLYLCNNDIDDISPVRSLTGLVSMRLDGNNIESIAVLKYCLDLEKLDLRDNSIHSIDELSGLLSLKSLKLSDNYISDLSPLMGMPELSLLWLENNNISDISPLASLGSLNELALSGNPALPPAAVDQLRALFPGAKITF